MTSCFSMTSTPSITSKSMKRELAQRVHLLTAVLIIGSNEDHKGIDGTTYLTPAATVPGVPQVESSDHKKYAAYI